jgi:hypothetical protein
MLTTTTYHSTLLLHPILLPLLHSFLPFPTLWKLRSVCQLLHQEITQLLSSSKQISITRTTISSLNNLYLLFEQCNQQIVESLDLEIRIKMPKVIVNPATTSQATNDDELSNSDKRTIVYVFPLGLLPKFPNLKYLRVTSYSDWHPTTTTITTKQCPPHNNNNENQINTNQTNNELRNYLNHIEPWGTVYVSHTMGIQLGLANLHEIADSLPKMISIIPQHLERTTTTSNANNNVFSDIWGPDATPFVLKRLREQCQQLQILGPISSPGPRILSEIRRRWFYTTRTSNNSADHQQPQRWSSLPEVQDTYTTSIVDEFNNYSSTTNIWPSLRQVTICLPCKLSPYASGRSTVQYLVSSTHQQQNDECIGEIQDVIQFIDNRSIHQNYSLQHPYIEIIIRDYETRQNPNLKSSFSVSMQEKLLLMNQVNNKAIENQISLNVQFIPAISS